MGTLLALGLIWWLSRSMITSGLAIGLVVLAGVVVASTIVPIEAFTRSEGTGILVNADDRLGAWDRASVYFLQNPLLGVGWGQLRSKILQESWYVDEGGAAAHNSLLELLSQSGLVGTIPFVLLCWHVLRVLWRGARLDKETRGPLNVGLFAAFSGMLLATMTSNYEFERFFWVPIAFAASLELRGALRLDDGADG